MPIHQSGSNRYPYPPTPTKTPKTTTKSIRASQKPRFSEVGSSKLDSLARGPEAPAFLRPFFLIMKLDPMKALETTARRTPLKLLLLRSEAAMDGTGSGGGGDAIEDHVHLWEYAHCIKPQICVILSLSIACWRFFFFPSFLGFVFLVLAALVSWG